MCAPSSLGEELSQSARPVVGASVCVVKTPRSDGKPAADLGAADWARSLSGADRELQVNVK